ncbi:MAG: stage II sporulation protein R [Lachnospiraceae bacterium]|nr:stage II sporulation protein R [Lachnospiraceae bacterium]
MNINSSEKRWILLEQPRFQFPKRIWLLLFLYSLSFTLLLVGLRYFHADNESQKATAIKSSRSKYAFHHESNEKNAVNSSNLQNSLSREIIRLHVIANSDTNADQALKYEVRDSIITHLQNALEQAGSLPDAERILLARKAYIEETAKKTIRKNNCDYTVSISLDDRYFPAKQYGDLTFPPGTYRALCVEIGKAEGRNWWCVLFPCLCFVDETTAVVPDSSKHKLQEELSAEDYGELLSQSTPTPTATAKPNVRFRSGIYDWITGR